MISTERVMIDGVEFYGEITGQRGSLKLYKVTESGPERITGKAFPDAFIRYLNKVKETNDKAS